MSTTPEVINNTPDIREEVSTYCLVNTKNQAGEDITQFMVEKAAQKLVEEKKGEIVVSQSFKTYNAGNDAGFAELVPTEKERVRLENRGLDQKQYQIIRTILLETDKEGNFIFEPKEGSIDLRKDVAEEMAARATTPEAKLEKVLDGLDAATAASILEKLLNRAKAAQPATA